jgi:hypothetical protein
MLEEVENGQRGLSLSDCPAEVERWKGGARTMQNSGLFDGTAYSMVDVWRLGFDSKQMAGL